MSIEDEKSNKFVIYAFSREKDSETGPKGTYYYIGKGKPSRPYTCGNRKTVKCPRDRKNNIHILHENLEEDVAFDYERKLIKFYGRKDINEGWCVLRNRTDGGEGVSGVKMSKETKEKISGKNSVHYNPLSWSHPVHGFARNKSISEMVSMYKNDRLLQSGLSQLSCQKIFSYKKWVLVSEDEIDSSLSDEELSKKFGITFAKNKLKQIKGRISGSNNIRYVPRNWCHIRYGIVLNTSIYELIGKFPEEKLCASILSAMANGKRDQHKGWIFIDGNLIDNSLTKKELNDIFSPEYAKSKIREMREIKKQNRKKSSKPGPVILRDWYHPEHGVIRKISVSQIIKKYSYGEKLNPSLLYAVANGKRARHRGWEVNKEKEGEGGGLTEVPR